MISMVSMMGWRTGTPPSDVNRPLDGGINKPLQLS